MEWLVVAELLSYAVATLAAGAGVAARIRLLNARQRAFDQASERLAAAGFSVRPLTERYLNDGRAGDVPELELKHALAATLGDTLVVTVQAASSRQARGTIRRGGLEVVRRATFTIRREGAATRAAHAVGVHDIEIDDAAVDAALAIRGWPGDLVRALVARPEVRAQVSALFADEAVRDVRAVATTEEGLLRASWQLPWEQIGSLRPLADALERLARALDDARFVEPLAGGASTGGSTAGVSPGSGAPIPIPGAGRRR